MDGIQKGYISESTVKEAQAPEVIENVEPAKASGEADYYLELTDDDKKQLLEQIKSEYGVAYNHIKGRLKEFGKRLKLYNNQTRRKDVVGEPLIFTILNSLLASLYEDRLTVTYMAREMGDIQMEEHLNSLAEFDYEAMDMPLIQLDWLWDTLFFGYGLVDMSTFDRNLMMPIPEIIDPTSFLYDPNAESVDGNKKGFGGMRYLGREILLTKWQMESHPAYKKDAIEKIGKNGKVSTTGDQLMAEAREARQEAMGTEKSNRASLEVGYNKQYTLLEWRTMFKGEKWDMAKKILVVVDMDFRETFRCQELVGGTWNVIEKIIYRLPHQFAGVSVTDLVEDKQRGKSRLGNLAFRSAKADTEPVYAFNTNAVENRLDLGFGFNKFIPVKTALDVRTAIAPINKVSPNVQLYEMVMSQMDTSAQKATATPELQMGSLSKDDRTLGELNLVAQRVDTRYSLAVKTLMRGDKKFWRVYYSLYKNFFVEGISKKVIRLAGMGVQGFRPITRDMIVMHEDPDVKVESKILSDAKKLRKIRNFMQVMEMANADPTTNRRWALRHWAGLNDLTTDETNELVPISRDEYNAKEQNEALSSNVAVPVKPYDNHMVHISIHREANPTQATMNHILTHWKAINLQAEKPELFDANRLGMNNAGTLAEGLAPGQTGQMPGSQEVGVPAQPMSSTQQSNLNAQGQ